MNLSPYTTMVPPLCRCLRSSMHTHTLLLLLLLPLLLPLFICRCQGQTWNVGNDSICLRGFISAMGDGVQGILLQTWTDTNLAAPCVNGASSLEGVLCNNDHVFSILLNNYGLNGTISPMLEECSFLQSLELSSNSIRGNIPPTLGTLSYLTTLNISNNQLTDTIPMELSACTFLNVLDLHRNNLVGEIPSELGLLTRLKVFDVSYNQLSGAIPASLAYYPSTGKPRFNHSSFDNNKDLHGFPLSYEHGKGSLSVTTIVGIAIGSGIVSLIVSFTIACIWIKVTERGYAGEEGKESQIGHYS